MRRHLIALFIANVCSISAYSAEETQPTKNVESSIEQLDTIVVSDTPFSQQVGTQKITEEQIKNRPLKNGNITELLKSNPNVQFSSSSDTSTSAGEIAPNEVSINGEAFYNNNYTIDGISNNNNIDPANNNNIDANGNVNGNSPKDLPAGGTQEFWIDTSLLKSVEVFDSNISAKYGRFTGGVINAELKDPSFDQSHGRIFYRTTRDSWAHLYLEDSESYNQANTLSKQPQFKKEQYGVSVSQPLSDKASLMFSYNRTESKIPFHHDILDQWDTQKRINETYLLRGIYLPDNGDLWKATVMYSPHKSIYAKKDVKNGSFTNEGGGFSFNLQWDKNFDWGKMKSVFAYKKSGNEIKHNENNLYAYSYSGSSSVNNHDWCTSRNSRSGKCTSSNLGGFGKYSTEKETLTYKQDYNINAFDIGSTEHKIGFGWEINDSSAKYKRDTDSYAYTYKNDVLKSYIWYPARNVKVNDTNYAVYLEDSIQWGNLNATLGLRLDHDEFLSNTNLAPRFSTSYDVFGDSSTQIFGGINRYYSDTVLSYKLKNNINKQINYVASTDKFTVVNNQSYDVSDLKTPYTDEYVLGFSQNFYDTIFTFKWVNRHSKEQFTKAKSYTMDADGVRTYYMSNDGCSKNNTFSLNIEPKEPYKFKYANILWNLGAQISETDTNMSTYDDAERYNDYDAKAIINGKLKDISELPKDDYNVPWSAFFELETQFPDLRLTWNQRFSYTAGYKGYTTDDVYCPGGHDACGDYSSVKKVLVYDEYKQGSYFMLDWHFAYKQPTFKEQFLEVTLDINNVLNRKVVASSYNSSTTYKMGRNYWLGISYNW
ncbi:TonB-dependent receptor plug domain-containing protein [Mannheimia massilioguelmaensis]|uniref:TonB-dependent receptor plug domain-containing protein n=1 Tax=Mannheimia massilioguelmaensis TaxID=1604354 RepID=UPI000695E0F4|nr:TonB-dependent receptor plug domain-containing protein [Mannheimia massilioguelmaensis]